MNPMTHIDSVNDLRYNYEYDGIGRLIRQELRDGENATHLGATEYTYDLRNNVTRIANEMGGRTVKQWYYYTAVDGVENSARYASENLPVRYYMSTDRHLSYNYDSLNRLTRKTLSTNTPLVSTYSYKMSDRDATKGSDDTNSYRTTQVSTEHSNKLVYYYEYDIAGNITNIKRAGSDGAGNRNTGWTNNYRSYTYDDLSQLTSETNATTGKTYTYTYDNVGNITSKSDGTNTITYTYGSDSDAGWSKLLKSLETKDSEGNVVNNETIDYDSIGNPTSYRSASLTWSGRQLDSYSKNGTSITYTYDADGLRGSKTVNGAKSTYQYIDGTLLYEDRNGTDLYYYYDSYGTITAISAYLPNGASGYVFVGTNSLGDVNALYNADGDLIVRYEYDAWGKVLAETDANGNALTGTAATWSQLNPFRYRGYYYDAETQLYYLQSRYYDSEVGRFINADSLLDTTNAQGYNVYSYCSNNPVMRADPNGHFWDVVFDIVSIVYSVYQVIREPRKISNWVSLGADVASAALPFVSGGGAAVRAVSKADDFYDVGKNWGRVDDAYDSVKAFDDLYDTRVVSDFSGGACFIEGTQIQTSDKAKNIEDITIGDKVWATIPETGETELKNVVRTFVNETDKLVYIYVNGEEIVTTPEHPFYVSNNGWVGAIELRAGDKLVLINGEFAVVEKIQHEILEEPITVYNFEVEDFHTYYVGDIGVLVHNVCGARNTIDQEALIEMGKMAQKTGLSRADADVMWELTEFAGLSDFKNYHAPKYDSYLGGTQLHMKINGMHINIFEQEMWKCRIQMVS